MMQKSAITDKKTTVPHQFNLVYPLGFCAAVTLPFVCIILHLLIVILDKHILLQDFSKLTVEDVRSDTDFIRKDVPITYYKYGELHKVLPDNGWISSYGEKGVRLFRLAPGEEEKWRVDIDQMDTELTAYQMNSSCTNEHSWIGCVGRERGHCRLDTDKLNTSIGEILESESTLYGYFALLDVSAADYVERLLNLPFPMDRGYVDQSFVSNFENDIYTSPLHSNAATASLAVQVLGQKSWIFFNREDYIARDGFWATSVYGPFLPLRGPKKERMYWWAAKTRPGDLLFFPPNWGHSVWTHKGRNFMMNFRRPFITQTMFSYHDLFHAVFNRKFLDKIINGLTLKEKENKTSTDLKVGLKKPTQYTEGQLTQYTETKLLEVYRRAFDDLFCDDYDPRNIDRIMNKLMREVVETLP